MKIQIDPIWRKPHEVSAAAAWFFAGVMMWAIGAYGAEMQGLPAAMAWVAWGLAIMRSIQVFLLWEKKARLVQLPDFEMSGDQIMDVVKRARKLAKKGKLRIDF